MGDNQQRALFQLFFADVRVCCMQFEGRNAMIGRNTFPSLAFDDRMYIPKSRQCILSEQMHHRTKTKQEKHNPQFILHSSLLSFHYSLFTCKGTTFYCPFNYFKRENATNLIVFFYFCRKYISDEAFFYLFLCLLAPCSMFHIVGTGGDTDSRSYRHILHD